MKEFLKPTYFYNFRHPSIQELIAPFIYNSLSVNEKAAGLYLKVRDGWRYNPNIISLEKKGYRASNLIKREHGHCIDKAIILIAGLRGLGIPARINLAKVKNHIAAQKVIEKLGTDELTPHGNAEIFLNGKWRKATPAFNAALCRFCNVEPLTFDGSRDSIFQEFDKAGGQFMEYLEDYGSFEDFPFEFVMETMKTNYPQVAHQFDGKTKTLII